MNSEPQQSQQPLQTQTQRFLASFNKHCQKTHPNVFKNFAQLLKLVEEHMFDKDEEQSKQVEVQDIEEQLTKTLKSAKAHHKKGVLIIGPPGVGKTAFMKYYARRNFKLLINANCCNLIGVFKNRTTEVIDLLFEMANFSDQSILFFDEIDLLTNDEHSIQNIQTIRQTLLKNAKNSDYETPTVYSTNKPWKINIQAFLQTIHCSIQIPISSFQKRKALIKLIIKDSASQNLDTSMLDPDDIAQRTLNYLNSDIYVLVRQMMMEPYKQMIEQGKSIEQISKQTSFKIQEHHVNAAYNKIKPSILVNQIDQYRKWQDKFEQGTL